MKFVKMHGAGNDFVILDHRQESKQLTPELIKHICDRHRGVGCDQLILLEPSENADLFMRIYNPDGSQSGACGNATRCVADLANVQSIETTAGILKARREGHLIEVDMGAPKLPAETFKETIDGLANPVLVDMGNPHAVYVVDNLVDTSVETTGPKIETHKFFKNRTNVEFVEIQSRTSVRLRTWERGAGLTLACGSAACATVVACVQKGLTERKIDVIVDGGELHLEWRESDSHVLMTGPVAHVFEGNLSKLQA